MVLGGAVALGSLQYGIGSLQEPESGFYPVMLGVVLAFVGLLILVIPDPESQERLAAAEPLGELLKKHLRPWLGGVGGLLLFLILGRYGGLIPASFGLVFCAALGDSQNSLKAALILAAVTTAITVAVFHFGFQMQFPLLTFLD